MYTTQQEIDSFVNEYKSSRVVIETTVRAVLVRAQIFERRFKKPFYRFTKEEVLEMFKEAGAISATSLLNSNLTLKHATNFQLYTKGEKLTNNVYETITKDDLKLCVDNQKRQQMILTREQLTDIQGQLLNYTDRCILELLFRSVGAEDWAKELTFLEIKQVNKDNMCIYFKNGKIVPIDADCYQLIIKSMQETELISYTGTRVSKVVSKGVIYKIRPNTITVNDNIKDPAAKERRFRFIQRRLKLMNDYLGMQLTPTSITTSGLLHEIKNGMELNSLPFRQYVITPEAREIAEKFGIYSVHYGVILIEKLREYFE